MFRLPWRTRRFIEEFLNTQRPCVTRQTLDAILPYWFVAKSLKRLLNNSVFGLKRLLVKAARDNKSADGIPDNFPRDVDEGNVSRSTDLITRQAPQFNDVTIWMKETLSICIKTSWNGKPQTNLVCRAIKISKKPFVTFQMELKTKLYNVGFERNQLALDSVIKKFAFVIFSQVFWHWGLKASRGFTSFLWQLRENLMATRCHCDSNAIVYGCFCYSGALDDRVNWLKCIIQSMQWTQSFIDFPSVAVVLFSLPTSVYHAAAFLCLFQMCVNFSAQWFVDVISTSRFPSLLLGLSILRAGELCTQINVIAKSMRGRKKRRLDRFYLHSFICRMTTIWSWMKLLKREKVEKVLWLISGRSFSCCFSGNP